jgi:hypothetical protein
MLAGSNRRKWVRLLGSTGAHTRIGEVVGAAKSDPNRKSGDRLLDYGVGEREYFCGNFLTERCGSF